MQKYESNMHDDLKKIAPALSSVGKHNPFEIPEDYFETLPAVIQNRCSEVSKFTLVKDIRHIIFRRLIPVSVVAIIAIAFILLLPADHNNDKLAELSVDELVGNLDENFIIETAIENKVLEEEITSSEETDAIMDYLIDHGIDESDIENQM